MTMAQKKFSLNRGASKLSVWLCLIISSSSLVPHANGAVAAALAFDNTVNYLGYNWEWNPNEYGDSVSLAAGTGRYLSECMIGCWANQVNAGRYVQIRFYLNDGDNGTPGTMVYTGDLISVPNAGSSDIRVPLNCIPVADTFTWTVQWTGLHSNDEVWLPMIYPPTVGSAGRDGWLHSSSGWTIWHYDTLPVSFRAQFWTVTQAGIPFCNASPSSTTIRPGENANLGTWGNGLQPISFLWDLNNVSVISNPRITGNGTPNLSITGTQSGDAGLFRALAINSAGFRTNVVGALSVLPAPWWNQDIGGISAPGSAGMAGSSCVVYGNGADIWDNWDAFQYVYQSFSGDGSIVVRVPSLQNTDPWAKAGVMFRETLAPGSRHALMAITSANGTAFQRRKDLNGASFHTAGSRMSVPCWLKLVRVGNTFSGYTSAEGSNWTLAGSDTVAMPTTLYVGLAVCSHNYGVMTTASFESVQIQGPSVAPTETMVPTAITFKSARLNGFINPNGASTTACFEYGTTTSYGSTTASGMFGTTAQEIGFVLTGLTPDTTYHYRIVASSATGTNRGSDAQFTTLPVSTASAQAWVAGTSGLGLRLRMSPSLSAAVLAVMSEGALVALQGATQEADGYLWRQVTFGAKAGWAAAQYLVFAPPGITPTPPGALGGLQQLQTDGATPIAAGGTVGSGSLILAATTPGTSDQQCTVQFEVRPGGTSFSEPGPQSDLVRGGNEARVVVSGLANQGYHWRARVLDGDGVAGPWVTFSANATDFIVETVNPPLALFTCSPAQVFTGDPVTFTAQAASQSGLTFNWNFGGTQTASGAIVSQTFTQPGEVTVTLTATDPLGNQAQKSRTVSVASKNLVDRINAVAGQSQSLLDDVLASARQAANAADYFNQDVQSAPGDIEMRAALTAVSLAMGIGDNDLDLAQRTVEWVQASYGNAAADRLALKVGGIVGGKEVIRNAFETFVVKEALSVGAAGDSPSQVWVQSLANLVSQKRTEIESLRAQAVSAAGSLTPAQSALLVKELQARLLGNIALRDSYAMNASLPITFHDLKSSDESGLTTYNIAQFVFSVSAGLGASAVGLMAGPVAAVAAEATQSELDIFNTLASQSAEAQLLSSSISAVAQGPAVVNLVTTDIESCLTLIINSQTPPPTPAGTLVAVTPFSVGKFWTDNLWIRWVTKQAYADVTIQNTGDQVTTYRLEAFLTKTFVTGQLPIGFVGIGQRQYDIQTAVAKDGISLSPGRQTTVRLIFLSGDGGQVPKGQDITYTLTAHTASGYYRQDLQSHHFGTTYIDEGGNVVDPAVIGSAFVVQNPLRASLLVFPGTNMCQLCITVQNPVETPLLMNLGQDIPLGATVINAGGATIGNNHLTWDLDMQPGEIHFVQVTLQLPTSLNDPPLTNTTASAYDAANGTWLEFSEAALVSQIVSAPPPQIQAAGFTNGSFGLSVQALIPGIYRVEATRDFLRWAPLVTVTNSAGTFNVNDSEAGSYPSRFYRALRQ